QGVAVVGIDPEVLDADRVVAGQLEPEEDLAGPGRPPRDADMLGPALRRAGHHGDLAPGRAAVGAGGDADSILLASGPDLGAEAQPDEVARDIDRHGHRPGAALPPAGVVAEVDVVEPDTHR